VCGATKVRHVLFWNMPPGGGGAADRCLSGPIVTTRTQYLRPAQVDALIENPTPHAKPRIFAGAPIGWMARGVACLDAKK